jgi:hypothetical protein
MADLVAGAARFAVMQSPAERTWYRDDLVGHAGGRARAVAGAAARQQQGFFSGDRQAVTRVVHLEPASLVAYNAYDGAAPQIEVTLHNTGTGLAVLESATVSVRRVAVLR